MRRVRHRSTSRSASIPFSWSILLIAILEASAWCSGAFDTPDHEFFIRENSNTRLVLSNQYLNSPLKDFLVSAAYIEQTNRNEQQLCQASQSNPQGQDLISFVLTAAVIAFVFTTYSGSLCDSKSDKADSANSVVSFVYTGIVQYSALLSIFTMESFDLNAFLISDPFHSGEEKQFSPLSVSSESYDHDMSSISTHGENIDNRIQFPLHKSAESIEDSLSKKKRLARKAELARNARKQKKMRMQSLETEVSQLKRQISALEQENSKLQSRLGQTNVSVLKTDFRDFVPSLSSNCSEALKSIESILLSKDRSAVCKLETIESQLESSLPLMFLSWVLSQPDAFYENPDGLWRQLFVDRIDLSVSQLDAIKEFRPLFREYSSSSRLSKHLLQQLKEMSKHRHEQSNSFLSRFFDILSPDQLKEFFFWVDQNHLCVKVLESMSS